MFTALGKEGVLALDHNNDRSAPPTVLFTSKLFWGGEAGSGQNRVEEGEEQSQDRGETSNSTCRCILIPMLDSDAQHGAAPGPASKIARGG